MGAGNEIDNSSTTHVDALGGLFADAGSTPAASTLFHDTAQHLGRALVVLGSVGESRATKDRQNEHPPDLRVP